MAEIAQPATGKKSFKAGITEDIRPDEAKKPGLSPVKFELLIHPNKPYYFLVKSFIHQMPKYLKNPLG